MRIAAQSAVRRRLIQPAWTAPYSRVHRTLSLYSRALSGSTPYLAFSLDTTKPAHLGGLSYLVEMSVQTSLNSLIFQRFWIPPL